MRISRISSVAYATEDNASEEKTARAMVFDRRSWLACANDIGFPTNHRFSRFASTIVLGARLASSIGGRCLGWNVADWQREVEDRTATGARFFDACRCGAKILVEAV